MVELENGSTDTKIWKDVKRKRVRIPDLVCTRCGLRVESRAKTKPELSVSHSLTDAERAWDFGMVDSDVLAFVVCRPESEAEWARGVLDGTDSYWHSRDRVRWSPLGHINYFTVDELRRVAHSKLATKGVTEGSETSITWDAVFSTRDGVVDAVDDPRVTVRRSSDGHRYTWRNTMHLPLAVRESEAVFECQVLASSVAPIPARALLCNQSLSHSAISALLGSPQRTQRFTGVKLARLRQDGSFSGEIAGLASHSDEDVYVRLEGAAYLASVCSQPVRSLFAPFLRAADDQLRLEAIVALAETATDEAVSVLSECLDDSVSPAYLRSAAAWALGRVASGAAVARLVAAFADVDHLLREDALRALEGIGDAAISELVPGLNASDPSIASGCAEALRRQEHLPDSVLEEVLDLADGSSRVIWAAWLLGNLREARDRMSARVASLQTSNPEVHYAVSVLWAFLDSWVSKHWDPLPRAGAGLPLGSTEE